MTATATIERTTMTAEELREESHRILMGYLEKRGLDVLAPHGWRGCDATAYDLEDGATVLIRLQAEFMPDDSGLIPPIDVDAVEIERCKALVHAYVGEHPDETQVRADLVSLQLFDDKTARLRHLVGAYVWQE